MMTTQDTIERYLEEYQKTLSEVARMVAEHPDTSESFREMLNLSAMMLVTNKPGLAEDYKDLLKDMDAFLDACIRGEIDLDNFVLRAVPDDKAAEDI